MKRGVLAMVNLCATLEGTTLPPRVAERLANTFIRAFDKLCTVTWDRHIDDLGQVELTILRHMERGANDFIP